MLKIGLLNCGICILAGGLSARMGGDKAQMRLGSRTLIGHVRRAANALGLKVRIIRRDVVPRCGPIGGIYTGLITSTHDSELFLSCDMPFVTPGLLNELRGVAGTEAGSVFVESRRTIGFPMLIRVSDVLSVQKEIRAGRHSLQNLARRLKARRLRVTGTKAEQLFNVNTPEDWLQARRRLMELPL